MDNQHFFHFPGGNILPSPNDQIIGPSGEIDISVFIHITHIRGAKPSVRGKSHSRFLGILPVTAHNTGPAGHNLPGHQGRNVIPLFIDYTDLDIGQGSADGGCQPFQLLFLFLFRSADIMVLRAQSGDGRSGFSLAEGIDKRNTRESGDSFFDHFKRHGRCAIGHDLKTGKVELLKIREIDELFDHGRNQHGPVDFFPLNGFQPLFDLELPHQDQGPPAVNSSQDALYPGDMIEGNGKNIFFFRFRISRFNIGQDIG